MTDAPHPESHPDEPTPGQVPPAPTPPGPTAPEPTPPGPIPPGPMPAGPMPAWPAPPGQAAPYGTPAVSIPPYPPQQSFAPAPPPRDYQLPLGLGLGCAGQLIFFVLGFLLAGLLFHGWETLGVLIVTLLVPIVGIVLAFIPKTRRVGIGILITSAASWLIIIGPCIATIGW